MDIIKVQYGISLSQKEQLTIDYPLDAKEREMGKELKSKIKTATLPEFLSIHPNELSEKEQIVQRSIKLLYDLNGKKYPLYRAFPTFRSDTHPLTIDVTITETDNASYAFFDETKNKITFTDIKDSNFLVQVLAHELKHAQQSDEEVFQYSFSSPNCIAIKNAYAWHQLNFLKEAQAYATDSRAYYEIFGAPDNSEILVKIYKDISKKYTNFWGRKDYAKIETEMISFLLGCICDEKAFHYKNRYDQYAPIGEKDPGLDHIPDVFNLPQSLMSKLQGVPKKAASWLGKLMQARKNNHMDEYIRLLHEGVDKNEQVHKFYFEYVLKNGSPDQIDDILQLQKRSTATSNQAPSA